MALVKARSIAKGRFTRLCNIFEDALNDGESDLEDVTLCFKDVETAWHNVGEKHDEYLASLDEYTESEGRWLDEPQARFLSLRKRYVKYKNKFDVCVDVEALERARDIEYNTFIIMIKNIEESIAANYPQETISQGRLNLLNQFDELKRKHSDLSKKLPAEAQKKGASWLNEVITSLSKTINLADNYVMKSIDLLSGKQFKLDKLLLPKFDGDPRYFPRFKKEFLELVRPQLSKEQEAYMLRKCLGQKVEEILGAGDLTFDEILKRLEDRYGDPSRITDTIINSITKFRKIENDDNKRIIDFIGMIERAYHDLKSVKMEREINNTNVVSMIESKLPKSLVINWYRMIHTVDSKVDKANKFPSLLQFLITERNALEYGLEDLRSNFEKRANINYTDIESEKHCLIHKSNSHRTEDCIKFKELSVPKRYEVLKENLACFSCLSPDHIMKYCMNRVKCRNLGCGKFPIMKVNTEHPNQSVNVLWDTCASVSLITERKAKELKLKGSPSKLAISMVAGVEKSYDSMKYKLPITDLQGRVFTVEVFAIRKISDNIKDVDLSKIAEFFPDIDLKNLVRPKGEIDVLIGYNYAAWHPTPAYSVDHLVILSNSFGMSLGG